MSKTKFLSDEIEICSIGSGPSTELFGVFNQFGNRTIHFKGFDLNPVWQPINDFEKSLFSNSDVKFYYKDFIKYMDENDCRVDILILNYMLSDLARYKSANECSLFLDALVALCEAGRITFIVINDIYLTYVKGTGYALMEEFARKLMANKNINERVFRGHFPEPNIFQPEYGNKYTDDLSFPVAEQSVLSFDPMRPCKSLFMVIRIQ